MTGDEAIKSTTIAIDEVYYVGQIGALRGAQPVEIWFAEGVGKLVSKYHE